MSLRRSGISAVGGMASRRAQGEVEELDKGGTEIYNVSLGRLHDRGKQGGEGGLSGKIDL